MKFFKRATVFLVIFSIPILFYLSGSQVKAAKVKTKPKPPVRTGPVRIVNNSPAHQISNLQLKKVYTSDLIISKIIVQPMAQYINKEVKFTIKVKNICDIVGTKSKPCFVQVLFLAGFWTNYKTESAYFLIPSIPSNGEISLILNYSFSQPATWTISVFADGKFGLAELNENNNQKIKKFLIKL